MRRIAITNLKGGVGKTTTAVNLAAGLCRKLRERGERVLLIDLDPQIEASASSWLERSDPESRLLGALRGESGLIDLVQETSVPGLDLIPGCGGLARAEVLLSSEPGSETVLAGVVGALPERWSVVLLDTPPAHGWLMHSALAAASDVLVVIESGAMALGSLAGLDRVVSLVRQRLNPDLELFGVLQCRADARTRLYREVDELLKAQFPEEALSTIVRTDVRLLEAPGHCQDIFRYAPQSRAAEDFSQLADEVGARLGLRGF
ncbi:MAG: ParA family protein [Thermoanaerobaculia bacterium]|nr:ParA family protein [Thermoanaerobaculia bacterium]